MATINWLFSEPPGVDYSVTRDSAKVETAMASGRRRMRRRTTKDLEELAVVWLLDDLGYEAFKAFVHHELKSGTEWFNITLELGGGPVSVVARFKGDHSANYVAFEGWDVRAVLQLQEANQAGETFAAALAALELDLSDIAAEVAAVVASDSIFHTYVNQTLVDDLA